MMRGWRFDLWSFLVGVFTSGLLILLAYRFRESLHLFWQSIRQLLQILLPIRSNIEVQFRKDFIRFSQKEHLLSQMFPLDELLIPSRVIPLIPTWEKQKEVSYEDITDAAVPRLLDDPLFASSYRMQSFSLVEILAKGNSCLILLGELGTGKTTALIETGIALARGSHPYETLFHALPLYINAARLLRGAVGKTDILNTLVEAAQENYSPQLHRSLSRLVRKAIREQRLVLLIDGLDEIPPLKADEISDLIKPFVKEHPEVKIVLAASPNYLSDFVSMGFSPLLLCSWDKNEIRTFLSKWSLAWLNAKLASEEEIILWIAWATQESDLLTPLEWTLFLLLLFLKIPTPHEPQNLLETILEVVKLDSTSKKEIAQWAYQTLVNAIQNKPQPSPPNALDKLLSTEILVKTSSPEFRFASPVFLSFFASFANFDRDQINELSRSEWDVAALAARIAWVQDNTSSLTHPREFTKDQLINQVRYISYISPNSDFIKHWLKLIANQIIREEEPLYLRAKLFSALLRRRIDERLQFAKLLIQSKDPFLRQLGALGYGLLSTQDIQPLLNLIEDPLPNCFQAACLALVNLGTSAALDAVISALIHGHDRLKEAAAQSLANDPQIGHAILREAAHHEDARVRKAIISGLLRVSSSWAKETLQKMAIDEELWIIKDAAANAVSSLDSPNPHIPQKRPDPASISWLIQFAAQKGIGLTPGKPNQDVFLRALQEGDTETQLAVLDFYLFNPLDLATPIIQGLLNSTEQGLQSAAFQTLWSFSVCRKSSPRSNFVATGQSTAVPLP